MAVSAERIERLKESWEVRPGLSFALTSVDHKDVGKRYLVTAFAFFVFGGIEALLMRIQLMGPESHFLNEHQYDDVFTLHGMTMIFLFATPVLVGGFGSYLVPLMLGAREMSFPRLNAFSYWAYLGAGIFLYGSFLTGTPPNGGWYNYVPLSGHGYAPGPNIDYFGFGIIFLSISTAAAAINLLCTVFKLRAPGMSVSRLPLFVWSLIAAALVVVFAFPALMLACALLELDRRFGFNFYDPAAGGDPLLWQHLFWVFGHPEMYIVFLPATGIVSSVVPVFSRRRPVGYAAIAFASVSIGFLSFAIWAHMFTVGLPLLADAFFSVAAMIVAIPVGVQMFAWLLTVWKGRPVWRTPLLYILGFVVTFMVGGITGVMVATVPFDGQVTGTYFVVAHLHYALIGGMLFPILAGLYYWLPKITGRMLDERLGQLGFWLIFVGFNLAFFPMHISGLLGMPRRVYTYQAGLGWDTLNLLSSIGAFVLATGMAVVIADVVLSLLRGKLAPDDPWQADTLEWATSSPPPAYNFAQIPLVRSRHPLWEQSREDLFGEHDELGSSGAIAGVGARETIGTSVLEARPEATLRLPQNTYLPLLLTVGLFIFFAGFMPNTHPAQYFLLGAGILISAVTLLNWLGPGVREPEPDRGRAIQRALGRLGLVRSARTAVDEVNRLPLETSGTAAASWWGMLLLIASDATLFILLLFSYFYLRYVSPAWPPPGIDKPELIRSAIFTGLLVVNGVAILVAERSIARGNRLGMLAGLLLAFLLGAAFIGYMIEAYVTSSFGAQSTVYGSLFFVITGAFALHVIVGLLMLGVVQLRALLGDFTQKRRLAVQNTALYWCFLDVVWLFIFGAVYISPHITVK